MKNITTFSDMNKSQKELWIRIRETHNILNFYKYKNSRLEDLNVLSFNIDYIHHNRYLLLDEKFNDWRSFITKGLSMMINVFLHDISIEINNSSNPTHNSRITRSMAANHMKIKFNYIKMQENLIKKVKEISQTSHRKSSRIASIPA